MACLKRACGNIAANTGGSGRTTSQKMLQAWRRRTPRRAAARGVRPDPRCTSDGLRNLFSVHSGAELRSFVKAGVGGGSRGKRRRRSRPSLTSRRWRRQGVVSGALQRLPRRVSPVAANKTRTTALKRSPPPLPPPPHSASRPLYYSLVRLRYKMAAEREMRKAASPLRRLPPRPSQKAAPPQRRANPLPLNAPAPPPHDCHRPRAPSLPPSRLLLLLLLPAQPATDSAAGAAALARRRDYASPLASFTPPPPPPPTAARGRCCLRLLSMGTNSR